MSQFHEVERNHQTFDGGKRQHDASRHPPEAVRAVALQAAAILGITPF